MDRLSSVLFWLDQGSHFRIKTIPPYMEVLFSSKMHMLDQYGQLRSEYRSPKHLEGSIFSLWKTIEMIWGIIKEFGFQTCKLWVKSSPGAGRWQNSRSRSSPSMLGLRWFFCVSWWYQFMSLATTIRPAALFIVDRYVLKLVKFVNRANETFLRQVHHRAKMMLATA